MREYEIYVGGLPHTVQLDEATAKERGLTPITRAKVVPNKARTRTRNKAV
ncbi:hypothetical protein ABZU78_11920 [Rhodococcus erythropolis]